MRKITKEYIVYDYNDILQNDELKQKVLQNYYDINNNYDWYDYIISEWESKLEKIGFIKPEINFSGFWSQGDGASFTCEYIDIKTIAKYSNLFTNREINILYALYNYGYIEAGIKRNTHHYYHKYTVTNEFYDGLMPVRYKHFQKIVDKLKNYISDIVLDLCDEIYKDLEKEYEYLTSEESILETIKANEYLFNESGKIEL